MLIPLALLAAAAVYAYRKHRASAASPGPITSPNQIAGSLGAGSSALAALNHFMRAGQYPPPIVIQCALAEAQAMGRMDLADGIVRTFIAPVVAARHGRASNEPSDQTARPDDGASVQSADGSVTDSPSPEEVDALVDASEPYVPAPTPAPTPGDDDTDQGTVTVSGKSSPIVGVDNDDWNSFVSRLSREEPTFSTPRHVGRFRHRRDRLAELGIREIDTPEAQEAALEADMGDAFKHAKQSGLVDEYVSSTVAISDKEYPITLSGLLGVIQAAGLGGAYEWLEKPGDRKRYPHTTKMFLQTNGVF